ncbi:hypothetical protein LINPERPRIM_LOCUS320 [Linum perenne]
MVAATAAFCVLLISVAYYQIPTQKLTVPSDSKLSNRVPHSALRRATSGFSPSLRTAHCIERRIIGDGGSTIDLPLFSMEDEVPPPSSDVDRNDLVEARSGNPLPVLAPFQLAGPMEI